MLKSVYTQNTISSLSLIQYLYNILNTIEVCFYNSMNNIGSVADLTIAYFF